MLQTQGRRAGIGSIALGLNPGQTCPKHRDFFIQRGTSFDQVLEFWSKGQPDRHRYHIQTKRFLHCAGPMGPILWTEPVKCEKPPGMRRDPPFSTYRSCVSRYLASEVAAVPVNWPIVALGCKACELATILFPARRVIGIPHPTGSHGGFFRLFRGEFALKTRVEAQVRDVLTSPEPLAYWVTDSQLALPNNSLQPTRLACGHGVLNCLSHKAQPTASRLRLAGLRVGVDSQ